MEDRYLKKENETDFEYKVRLCTAKLNKEIDADWIELIELLKLDYSSDHLRKLSYGYKEYYDFLQDKQTEDISDDKILKAIELKKEELIKERKKLQTTKVEYNKNLRIDSRFELLYENIKDNIQSLEVPSFKETHQSEGNKGYILNISDIHYGSTFKSENNEYSREICKQRFEYLFNETIKIINKEQISNLIIVNNGDSIQGLLRINDLKMNDISIVQATIEIGQLLASWLNELSKYVNIKYYHVLSANHTQLRLLNSKANEMANEDLEKIIINYIHDVLINNDRIDIPIDMSKEYLQFELCGYNFLALHGHQVNNLKTSLRDYSMLHRKFYDTLLIGHFHGGSEVVTGEGLSNSTEVLVSPSFIGSCPYADSLLVGGKAMSKLYIYEEGKGRIMTYNIILN